MINKGDVYYANLNPVIGSEQGGIRPVVILQNDIGNKYRCNLECKQNKIPTGDFVKSYDGVFLPI